MAKYKQHKTTGEWVTLDEATGSWVPSPGPPQLTGPPPSKIETAMAALNPPLQKPELKPGIGNDLAYAAMKWGRGAAGGKLPPGIPGMSLPADAQGPIPTGADQDAALNEEIAKREAITSPVGALGGGIAEIGGAAIPFNRAQAAISGPLSKLPWLAKTLDSSSKLVKYPARAAAGAVITPATMAASGHGKDVIESPALSMGAGAAGGLLGGSKMYTEPWGLGKRLRAEGRPPTVAGPPVTETGMPQGMPTEPPSADITRRLLGDLAGVEGVPLAPEEAGVVAGVERFAEKVLGEPAAIRPPAGPAEVSSYTLGRTASETGPPASQLFPEAMMSKLRYGEGRGPVSTVPDRGFGVVPRERWGTETAKLQRQMQNIDHIKHLLGVQ